VRHGHRLDAVETADAGYPTCLHGMDRYPAHRRATAGRRVTKDRDPYSRYYWRFADEFPSVYRDDALFAGFMRLLALSDATYPAAAPIPRWIDEDVLRGLEDAGVVLLANDCFRMKGQQKERRRRSKQGKAGAKARWEQSERTATNGCKRNANAFGRAMHTKTRRDETSNTAQRRDK
jgi:hypothetical protein